MVSFDFNKHPLLLIVENPGTRDRMHTPDFAPLLLKTRRKLSISREETGILRNTLFLGGLQPPIIIIFKLANFCRGSSIELAGPRMAQIGSC